MKRMNNRQREKSVFLLALLIIAALYVTPVKGEEEYHLIATLQSPIPHGYSLFGDEAILGDDFLVIGELGAVVSEEITGGKIFIYGLDWNLVASFSAPNPEAHEVLSGSVAVSGDLILVANEARNIDDYEFAGEAYLLTKDGTLQLTLQSPQPREGGTFGNEVNFRNGFILIAETEGNFEGLNAPGLVHVFDMEGNHITTLKSPSMKPMGKFGKVIEMNDNFIAISEPGRDAMPLEECSVYIFNYDWEHVATLNSPDHQPYSLFGKVIELTNDLLLVSEKRATVDGHEMAGRVHLYDTDLNLLTTLQAPEPEDNAEFGTSLAIGGDLILVGEVKRDVEVLNEGMVYVYDLEGNPLATLVSSEPEIGAQFGEGVETDGEIIIVSHIFATAGGVSQAGRVEIYAPGPPVEEIKTDEEPTPTGSESEPEKKGIPGFPYGAILLGVVSILMLWSIQRRR
jgi:hypothetical protein